MKLGSIIITGTNNVIKSKYIEANQDWGYIISDLNTPSVLRKLVDSKPGFVKSLDHGAAIMVKSGTLSGGGMNNTTLTYK